MVSKATRRLAVVAVILGAVAFGAFVGYEIWANDSFPVQQRPFSQYASVRSASFNGTELVFALDWNSTDGLPEFAQITSSSADTVNSPVCDLGLAAPPAGRTVYLPFATGPRSGLSEVELSVAVKSLSTGVEFTVVYQADALTATPGDFPQAYSCFQPSGG